ncbi:MAG TPA: translation initiation factor IF-2 N-terminal domain-containing protein [Jatrophihabitans sp.]|jgi:ribonuclease E
MLDNDDSTDSNTDNFTAVPPAGAPTTAPAKRVRVSALAKELGVPSKSLVALLAELGEGVKTASSALDEAQAERVRAAMTVPAVPAERDQPAGPTEEAAESVAAVEDVAAPPVAPAVLFQPPEQTAPASRRRRRAAKAPAGPPATQEPASEPEADGPDITVAEDAEDQTAEPEDIREAAAEEATGAARRRRRRGRRGRGGGGDAKKDGPEQNADTDAGNDAEKDASKDTAPDAPKAAAKKAAAKKAAGKKAAAKKAAAKKGGKAAGKDVEGANQQTDSTAEAGTDESSAEPADEAAQTEQGEGGGTRRRRRRRRSGSGSAAADTESGDDPPNTVTHVREVRDSKDDDGVKGVKGSTRLEARRQRRRDGRESNRRRPPILTEAEFLARREAVDRVMAVRQNGDRTQIAVLEDDVLVEHYVTRASATSYVGNIYLGRVQNVLPSMEAAFIDIGKGRNGVLYAGEVNWDAAGLEGKSRAIEQALKSGDAVLVQVTKDPIGHKGARLTSQISLPGRFLVYVPGGGMTGISRRLPDTERHRLKAILKKIVPEDAGVIVRTAAEGASEEDLTRDVERLQGQWEKIQKKAEKTSSAPTLVHGEPDLAIRVVRDVFNEDFKNLIVQGEDAWTTVSEYVEGVAPDLAARVSKHTDGGDLFHDLRVDEQLMKALDRKVWLPSGGSLVIDRTEAMTVIDVNTGKFIGSGGNLEQTVTRNNLEAAEEIVRQLRLRDVGGIVVIDFIDMVLESNRELVLRRLTECLGRDRTKHQVAEVTSLGLVQMTRKRVGEGLLEAFSETCEVCHGRGVIVHTEPVEKSGGQPQDDDEQSKKTPRRRRGKRADDQPVELAPPVSSEQRNKALAAMSAIHKAAHPDDEDGDSQAAELQLDAVTALLAGNEIDVQHLAEQASRAAAASDADGASSPQSASSPAAEPEPAAQREPSEAAEPAAQPEKHAAAERRPRRRRAASRPAGPPGSS